MRKLGLILLITLVQPGLGEEHGSTDPTPLDRQRADGLSPLDVELLKKRLIENAGTPRWWSDLHEFLGAVDAEKADAFAKELPSGKAKDLFEPAAKDFFSTDTGAIRERAKDDSVPSRQEAAVKDIERRLKDPNTILISTAFNLRGELAMDFAAKLLATEDDPEAAAKILARLMGTLTSAQREKVLELANSQKGKDTGINPVLLDRLARAAALAQGARIESDFDRAFNEAYNSVLNRNREFHQDLRQALAGDKEAAARLKQNFGGEALMDFVSSQLKAGNDGLAVDIVDAMTRNPDGGQRKLSLTPTGSVGDKGEDITLLLGDADGRELREQIRASLEAVESASNFSHGDGSPLNGFAPGGRGGKEFAPVLDDNGKLTLAEVDRGVSPEFPRRPVQRRRRSPSPPAAPPEKPDPVDPDEPPATDALTEAQAVALIEQKCASCHRPPKTAGSISFQPQDAARFPQTARRMLAALERPAGGNPMPQNDPGFRDTAQGKKLREWLRTQAE